MAQDEGLGLHKHLSLEYLILIRLPGKSPIGCRVTRRTWGYSFPLARTPCHAQQRRDAEVCALTTSIDFRPHGLVSATPDQNHGIFARPTLDLMRLRSMLDGIPVRCLCSFASSFLIFLLILLPQSEPRF